MFELGWWYIYNFVKEVDKSCVLCAPWSFVYRVNQKCKCDGFIVWPIHITIYKYIDVQMRVMLCDITLFKYKMDNNGRGVKTP